MLRIFGICIHIMSNMEQKINRSIALRLLLSISATLAALICGVLHLYIVITTAEQSDYNYVYYWLQQESNPFDYSLDTYRELEQELQDNTNYYEIYTQYLERISDDQSLYYNYDTDVLDADADAAAIPALQLDMKSQALLQLSAEQGTLFQDEDYGIGTDGVVPVLLGSGYQDVYQVGDTFTLYYLYSEITCEVIGILEPSYIHQLGNKWLSVDTSIILPMFDVDPNRIPDSWDANGIKIHYANRVSGLVIYNHYRTADIKRLKELLEHSPCGSITYSVSPLDASVQDGTGIPLFVWGVLSIGIMTVLFCITCYIRIHYNQYVRYSIRNEIVYISLTMLLLFVVRIFARLVIGVRLNLMIMTMILLLMTFVPLAIIQVKRLYLQ